MRVLIVDDHPATRDLLVRSMERAGHVAVGEGTCARAAERLGQERFDVTILDVMLPDGSGMDLCRSLRSAGCSVPILLLTARGGVGDRVAGLDAGADDYLAKPFELPILLSRVRGLLRRHEWFRAEAAAPASPVVASQFSFGDKSIDFEQLEVRVGDRRMPLTLMEAALLRYFVQHEGSPVPRKEILERVWGVHEDTDTRAIDNFIVRLRRYIEEEPSNPRHLQTVRGVGYRFVANPE